MICWKSAPNRPHSTTSRNTRFSSHLGECSVGGSSSSLSSSSKSSDDEKEEQEESNLGSNGKEAKNEIDAGGGCSDNIKGFCYV